MVRISQQRLAIEPENVANEALVIVIRLNINRLTAVPVTIFIMTVALYDDVIIQRRMSRTQTRKLIAERRDVDRIPPISIALVVLAVVALQKLHVRCRV